MKWANQCARAVAVCALLWSLGGCGETVEKDCAPGSTQACTCTDGASGAQECNAAGSGFDSCVCTGAKDDVAGADTEDTGSGQADTEADTSGVDPCDCTANKIECGFVPGCSKSCGACPAGQQCTNNKCVQKQVVKKVAFGGACGPNKDCVYPGSGSEQSAIDAYFDCLDSQCESNRCRNGVCIKTCVMTKDSVNNASGAAGSDGVEDPDQNSECDDAEDGPYGNKWRCVEFRDPPDVLNGQSLAFCYPGIKWKPCKSSADCDEPNTSCQLRYKFGQYGTVCVPKRKPPKGEQHVGLAGTCNTNPMTGDLKICDSNWCSSSWGCRAFCGSDLDCVTDPGACKNGACTNGNGGSCTTDADCSAYFCKSGLKYYSNVDQTFSMCYPKNCELTSDCGDGFGCRLNWNGVSSEEGDPDPNDASKVIYPGWNHLCLPHKEGGVKAGELCDKYPSDDNKSDPYCENSSFCRDGFCGNLCKNDKDCASNMKCGVTEFGFDSDDDGWYDYRLAADHCVGLPGATTSCVSNSDCGSNQVCKPWIQKTSKTLGTTPDKAMYTSAGTCIDKIPNRAQFASYCGVGQDGVQCQTNICLSVFSGQNYGICTDACNSRFDCPPKVKIGNYTYKAVCSSRWLMGNQTLLDPTDDVYTPVCWPSSDGNSLDDCSKTRTCDLKGEACYPRVITRGPDTAAKVEYWCMRVNGSNEPAPTKKNGEVCDPEADVNPCVGGYCLEDSGKPGKGYCSSLCLKDADCGSTAEGMFCHTKRQQIPRKDASKAAVVPLCMKPKACIPCSGTHQCTPGRLCTNVGGTGQLVDRRCSPECSQDSDCAKAATSDAGVAAKCIDQRNRFGKKTGKKVCATQCGS